jgi:uncharacterized protein
MVRHSKLRDMRGFASMSEELQREIAAKGGVSVPAKKRTFHTDRKLAKTAGSLGGSKVAPGKRAFAKDPALASAAGRLGALAREKNRRRKR